MQSSRWERLRLLPRLAVTAAVMIASIIIWAGDVDATQGDEQRRFLEVRRRQLELQVARKQAERVESLAAEGLVPRTEVDRERNNVAAAQLNYQQAVLALLDLQPRISVRSAVKTQSDDGRKFVHLVIANLTPTFDDSQFKLLNNFDGADPIPQQLRTRAVNDIFVSLRDGGPGAGSPGATATTPRVTSAAIALPYEAHITRLDYGEERTLKYQLLRDVDMVTVALAYRNQTQEVPIQLQHSAGADQAQILSSQSSQEADLGGQVTYQLALERPTVDVRSFDLRVLNLPRQIDHSFIDPQSQARLSQINFGAGVTRQSLELKLSLPERADEQVRLDQPLEFWALVLDQAASARYQPNRAYTEAELQSLRSGKIKLTLIPRGVGRLEALAASLFSEVEAGQQVETRIVARNTGTRRLDNVRISAECPLNWQARIEPDVIPALDLNREEAIVLRILPPADVAIGDYEVRIKTQSFADNRRVTAEDKIYRISVKARTNLLGAGALVGAVIALAGGAALIVVRLTRR